jgi:hypothetical protein
MGCLTFVLALISPRLALAVVWIFTDLVDRAFESWVLPFLGLLFFPWTTLMYALVWSGGVDGIGWLFVALGVIADLGSYGASARRGTRTRA